MTNSKEQVCRKCGEVPAHPNHGMKGKASEPIHLFQHPDLFPALPEEKNTDLVSEGQPSRYETIEKLAAPKTATDKGEWL